MFIKCVYILILSFFLFLNKLQSKLSLHKLISKSLVLQLIKFYMKLVQFSAFLINDLFGNLNPYLFK